MKPPKQINNGTWTQARFKSFIVSQLRAATQRWGPKGCGKEGPATLPPPEGNKRRIKNIVADHINPIVDPAIGFTTYDDWITRCFVELDGYQALCHKCHTAKTADEREISQERKANVK